MVNSLTRYYPEEFEFLRLVAHGETDFAADLAAESPAMVNHLSGYGVLDDDRMRISIPVFETWLRQHDV